MDSLDIEAMVDQFLGVSSPVRPHHQQAPASAISQSQAGSSSAAAPPSFGANAMKLYHAGGAALASSTSPAAPGGASTAAPRTPARPTQVAPSSTSAERRGGSYPTREEFLVGGAAAGHHLSSPSVSGRQRAADAPSDPTLRRIQLWAERKDARLAQLVHEQLQREREECPFQPQREAVTTSAAAPAGHSSGGSSVRSFSPNRLYADNKAWGYDAFVDRLLTARATKAEQEEEDKKRTGHYVGQRWKGGVTTPEPFELGRVPTSWRGGVAVGASGKKELSVYEEYAPLLREQMNCVAASTVEPPSIPKGVYSSPCSQVIVESNRRGAYFQ